MKPFLRSVAAAALLCATASANDGFGGLSATGLQFEKSDSIKMLSEDLYLSEKKVKVAYVFYNAGQSDVTGEVIFPLPPISLGELWESDFAIDRDKLDSDNFVNFTIKVDGKVVQAKADRIAVIPPPYDENAKPADAYETPGEDITAILAKYGIPLSLNNDKVRAVLVKLPKAAKDDLQAKGIADFSQADDPYPAWAIVERFHWTQTFKAGADMRIEHSYDGAFPGGIFVWSAPSEPESYQAELVKKYCIDAGTQKAIVKALRKDEGGQSFSGMAYYIDYVLMTAKSWAGPIGDFKLTIDKGNPKNVISLCIDDIHKTSPTTFVMQAKNFTPKGDLSILLVPDVTTLPQ